MNKFILILFVFITCSFGCKKAGVIGETSSNFGSLAVYVSFKSYDEPVKGIRIYTNPKTEELFTDKFGSVLFTKVPHGGIEVFAAFGDIDAKFICEIGKDELTQVQFSISKEAYGVIAPNIRLMSLDEVEVNLYGKGDAIPFKLKVNDNDTPSEEIKIKIVSSLDGIIFEGNPNAEGLVDFTKTDLSYGMHDIVITALDSKNLSSEMAISISTMAIKKPVLYPLEKVDQKVILKWSKYNTTDFDKYEVYRSSSYESEFSLIAQFEDIHDTTFTDSEIPIVNNMYYYVKAYNSNNSHNFSETKGVEYPGGFVFNFIPSQTLKHPNKDIAYLFSNVGRKLVMYNYQTGEIEETISFMNEIGTATIGDNGFGIEIYVPSSTGKIFVYNAEDLSLQKTINTEDEALSVAINGKGHVIVNVDPGSWSGKAIQTYSRSSGSYIDGKYDYVGEVRAIPGKNEFITISVGISPTNMAFLKLNDAGHITEVVEDTYHGDHHMSPKIFRISENGEYILTAYSGTIYAANSGQLYLGQIMNSGYWDSKFIDFATNRTSSVIYAAANDRKAIKVYNYPSFLIQDEIPLVGYPKTLIYDDQKNEIVVVVMSKKEYAPYSKIQVVQVP